ncbi:hypothetical protein RQP54_18425 [Curvibacter sp. APW13]|uniref:hypothetical protein n=1 Tax=Curvibacter sp. APW13 TaxID=3077236 RepID=UPI0028DF476B|nr:hypothetical protein [Curvibacter sp. APW13]MDT8992856.1 hypothetical protein [Curvibacter sp. APW13]
MSTLLNRLKALRGARAIDAAGDSQGQERRSKKRRPDNAPAICVPVEGSTKGAFVLGVQWVHDVTDESIDRIASREAKAKGFSHIYTNGRNGQVYGLINVDPQDLSQHGALIPLAAAFAKSVQDKNARSIYVFDMRESATSGNVYFAVTSRGSPIKEIICPADQYFGLLTRLANEATTPATVFVDTPFEETFKYISGSFSSATSWPITKISAVNVDVIHRPNAFNISRTHLVLLGLIAVGVLTYTHGIDYYQSNMQAKSDEELQRSIVQRYVNGRQQTFNAGYAATPADAIAALKATVSEMPLFRNGWQFKEAVCSVELSGCTYEWVRVYGTNDSFIESASLDKLKFDAADYKKIIEEREFKPDVSVRPQWDQLPVASAFVRDNGDRKDTFSLAGIDEFTTEAMTDLIPWTGKGAPPSPVLAVAGWSMSAPIEQVYEAIANQRIGNEFGINKLTVTNREGQILLKVEGKVYARKS